MTGGNLILVALVASGCIFSTVAVGKAPETENVRKKISSLPGKLRNLEKELEDIDRRLNRRKKSDAESNASLIKERQKISLEAIHEAQRYIWENRNKRSVNLTGVKMLLDNESDTLEKSFRYPKMMPFVDDLKDVESLIKGIRSGKVKYNGRRAGSDAALLKEIQNMQKEALEKIHRFEEREKRKGKGRRNSGGGFSAK